MTLSMSKNFLLQLIFSANKEILFSH